METIALNLRKLLTLRLNIVVYSLGFSIPFLLSQPQLVTGTIINSLLFISSERLGKKALYPILVLPSLGAISHGILFGPQTVFLFYFLPFIWIGNYFQTFIFSLTKQQNYIVRILFSGLAKYSLLSVAAGIYFGAQIVPQIFVTSMGVIQLTTAILGGLLAYPVIRSLRKYE